MAIVQRRIFQAKVGTADQLVNHLQEGEKVLRQHRVDFKSRILTDYMSGRTDRVVAEWEVNTLGEIDASMDQAMADPQARTYFTTWIQQLNELIHYAEVENWAVR